MPATRSGSVVHQRPQPFPKVSPSGTGAGTGGNGEAAIPENSEADLDKSAPLIPKPSTSTLPRSRTSAAPHPSPRRKTPFVPPPDEEIIEISSDEESSPARPARMAPSVLAEHRRELSRMRAEMAKAKKEKSKAEAELRTVQTNMRELLAAKNKALDDTKNKLAEAQAAATALATAKAHPSGSQALDPSVLDEQLECDICTRRLWTPYIIPDCGHTFCESCLIEWFGVAHAQFMQDHPVNPMQHDLLYILDHVARTPGLLQSRNILDVLRSRLPPTPKYTCPSCRGPVTSRPVEDYSLKQVVHKVAEAMGEKPPPSKNSGKNGKGTTGGIWDGFFPPITKP
ncbi:hypothetical protein D9619_001364 [Psilocybe cf. subviscida]|uniref:RING-type domain-containing protein n=1 Tax=Psilocybe cf. subviscida TaxID=2480587 RepID=A0A8H5BG37_9AGAR|nr:hypothetical protein D9619_001364 [Psilocybe cf. subviscida]